MSQSLASQLFAPPKEQREPAPTRQISDANNIVCCGCHVKTFMLLFAILRILLIVFAPLKIFLSYHVTQIPDLALYSSAVQILIGFLLFMAAFVSNRTCIPLYALVEIIFCFYWILSSSEQIFNNFPIIKDFGFDGPSFALIFAAIVLSLLAVFFMKILIPYYKYLQAP